MRPLTALTLALLLAMIPAVAMAGPVHETDDTAPREYNGIKEGDAINGELTHYCVCITCCGKTDGITASGQVIRNGMDDPLIVSCNWLPFGAIVEVNGVEYTVADRGGSGLDRVGRLDVFTPDGHEAALKLGRKRDVEIRVVELP